MGWKTQKIRNLQKDAAIESERDCPSIYTQFRIMERRCRRFFLASQTNNSCLPNVDPALLIHDNSIELIEGVILLRGHLSILKQKDLIRVCLELDHPSNLDTHYNIPEKMWEKYRGGKELVIEPKADKKPLTLAKAIRDGKNYNWATFAYDAALHPMPTTIDELVLETLALVGLDQGYKCQAGILNFYGLDDSLMGHQDKSEENTTAPLVSFSLGHSCIYLLGTEDRNDKPIPIVLESGDVLIIRDAARQRFHGVPKILENSLPLYLYPSKIATLAYIETIDVRNGCFRLPKLRNDLELLEDQEDKDDWDLYGSYMLESRININIRKVEV